MPNIDINATYLEEMLNLIEDIDSKDADVENKFAEQSFYPFMTGRRPEPKTWKNMTIQNKRM